MVMPRAMAGTQKKICNKQTARLNVATSMVGFKNSHIRKNLIKMVNSRDTAGNAEEEEEMSQPNKLQDAWRHAGGRGWGGGRGGR